MTLEGTVTNVTNFGAFVDVGVHQDGLVHLSQMSNRFIRDPREAVKVGDVVQVKVISVETETKRIGLSMKALLPALPRRRRKPRRAQPAVGATAAPTDPSEPPSQQPAVAEAVGSETAGNPERRRGPRPPRRDPRRMRDHRGPAPDAAPTSPCRNRRLPRRRPKTPAQAA